MTGPLIEFLEGQALAGVADGEKAILTQVKAAVIAAQEDLTAGRDPGTVVYERKTVPNRDLQELVGVVQEVGGNLPDDALITDLRHPYSGKKWRYPKDVNPSVTEAILADGIDGVDYNIWHKQLRVRVPYPYPDWQSMMAGLTKGEQDRIKRVLGKGTQALPPQARYTRDLPDPLKTVGELRTLTADTMHFSFNAAETNFLTKAFAKPQPQAPQR